MKKAFSVLLILLLLCACKKQLDDKDYWSFRYSLFQNDEPVYFCYDSPLIYERSLWDIILRKPVPPERGAPYFSSIMYFEEGEGVRKDDNITVFVGPCFSWAIDAPYVLENERYEYKLVPHSDKSDYRVPYTSKGLTDAYVISGWVLFTKKTDDPEVRLRIEFEADCVILRQRQDSLRHITNGVLEYSKKVSIGGMNRLIP